jgi:CDP-glycerol glycerophosphotransferase (TagB/SpsB family)
MKQFIFKIFRFTIRLFYILSKYFVKEEFVIIAGYKARYLNGNNLYLFEYLESIDTEFQYYFYTKDKVVYSNLKHQYSKNVLYSYSWRTLMKLVKAKVLVLISGPDDLSPFPLFADKKIVNLWHGIPMKKIGYESLKNVNSSFDLFAKSIDIYTVSSDFDKEIIENAFRLDKSKVRITGLQSNDYFNNPQDEILKYAPFLNKHKIILYAPTFREAGMSEKEFIDLFPIEELHEVLERYDAYFLFRSHINTKAGRVLESYPRIKSASSSEFPVAQPLLYYTDILITDYSGIFFDFLLMDRPIIFYNYDYLNYIKYRGLIMNYEENTPGMKVQTKKGVLEAIEKYLEMPDKDIKVRKLLKRRFHKYTDGKACERTYEIIKELM